MWTRELLKTNAKQALQGRYWRSFWICLVLSFVGLGGAGANSGNAAHQAVSTVTDDTTAYDIINSIPDSMLGAIFVGMLIGSIAALCWALFVVYPLNVGRCRYFMESRQSLTPVSTVVSAFRRPYGNPIVVQLLTDLKIALGFLLLIVPGIYWEYCYELVPYLRYGTEQGDDGGREVELLHPQAVLLWLAAALRVHLRHRRLLFGTVYAGDLRGILRRYAQQGTGHGHDDYRRARRLCAA